MILLFIWLAATLATSQESLPHEQETRPSAQSQPTVKVFISVLDKSGSPVLDLRKEEVQIYEGREEIQVLSIKPASSEPLRIGILVDVSGSQNEAARSEDPDDLSSFIRTRLTPKDFAFVATFAIDGAIVSDWTDSPEEVGHAARTSLASQRHGGSSINDSIYWACENKLGPETGDKFLLILSDMEDNSSNHTRTEAIDAALRASVPVFVLKEEPALGGDSDRAKQAAIEFPNKTGGLAAKVQSSADFHKGLEQVGQALAGRYILEFAPSSVSTRSGFHKIKLKCSRQRARILAPSAYFVADN
jgi:VWFA-related protein